MSEPKNQLYYGDNLDVLARYVNDESIDLVYLDPPFNSRQDYNVLFAEKDGSRSSYQIRAFKDTWEWNLEAKADYEASMQHGGRVAEALRAFHTFLGGSDMLAYLAMMARRLIELKRVLKETGTIYLHCDATASHYLKMLMDAIFGPQCFRNEIAWRRSHPKGHAFTRFARNHDAILVYSKGESPVWNRLYVPQTPENAAKQYALRDESGRAYQLTSLLNPNPNRPNLTYEFLGVKKVWRWTRERMLKEYENGSIVVPRGGEGIPRYKRYFDEQEGIPVSDFWDDIEIASGTERLGYPTQKPEALLERILSASSKEGDVVLDPFCGCGTTIQVAQRLNRRWIGIDITHLAVSLIKKRLSDTYGDDVKSSYEMIGEPTDLAGAAKLAEENKYQFQWWALGLVGARPAEQKKGADRGIDGRLYFHDDERSGKTKQILLSVKAGGVQVSQVRDLRGTVEREEAEIGAFLCFESPTKPMLREAAEAGFYTAPDGSHYPRMQILTIQEILEGKQLNYPRFARSVTFKEAPKAQASIRQSNLSLFTNPGD